MLCKVLSRHLWKKWSKIFKTLVLVWQSFFSYGISLMSHNNDILSVVNCCFNSQCCMYKNSHFFRFLYFCRLISHIVNSNCHETIGTIYFQGQCFHAKWWKDITLTGWEDVDLDLLTDTQARHKSSVLHRGGFPWMSHSFLCLSF